jgi:hypothetical protein
MKRILLIALLLILVVPSIGAAQAKKKKRKVKKSPPCAVDLAHCPTQGCGGRFDPNLNLEKNIRTSDQTTGDRDFSFLAALPKIVPGYKIGDTREKVAAIGEGKMIRVMAFALVARKGGAETCNCRLTSVADTDNHIVLVSPELKRPSLLGERNSETAEFTPRVRLDHPNLNRAKLQALINAAPRKALLVRVTGLQMYDSEHALGPHKLKRKNDWEIHPVFGLEFCPKGKTCTATGKANWVDIEQ